MAPTFKHAKGSKIYANNFGLTTVMREHSWDRSVELADVTTYGDDDRVFVPGQRDGSLNMSGLHDGSTAETDRRLKALAGSTGGVAITLGMPDDTAGNPAMLVNGLVSQYSVTSPAGDVVQASASVQFSSQAWSGVWLSSRAARATATTHGTIALVGSSASTRGAIGHLHVFANTTNAAGAEFQATIQDSSNGSVWADLITFTAINSTATTGTHERLKVTGTVYDNARLRVPTQNSTSVEYAAALARL
jgi:hypothetical protein